MNAARVWPLAVVAVLVLTVGVNLFVLVKAREQDAAVVAPDYYRKAVAYDTTLAAARRSDALGWHVAVELTAPGADGMGVLRVRLTDRAGLPVEGAAVRVIATHNLLAGHALRAALAPEGDGRYAVPLPLRLRGLWELDVSAARGADRYGATVRCDTGAKAAG